MNDTSLRGWDNAAFTFQNGSDVPISITVRCREHWALKSLMKAGDKGCTPIDTPGPRWAAYVHSMRALGVELETIHKPHDGPFKGTLARYVLRSTVTPGNRDEVAA